MEEQIVAEENEKPVFDEETLGRLLEAAYVLQEHRHRLQEEMALQGEDSSITEPSEPVSAPAMSSVSLSSPAISPSAIQNTHPDGSPAQNPAPAVTSPGTSPAAKDDYTLTLAQIVEVQHQIQLRRLTLDDVMTLVCERVSEIARADGAGIGIRKDEKDEIVGYRAAFGSMTLPRGTEVPIEKALCAASLRTGQVIRCAHVNAEFLVNAEECRRRAIQSLIVVPVYHEGGVAGALELYYSGAQAFGEHDVHSCQLMAGLITEALARAEEQTWKQSLADERAAMMEALEKLKPNLTALVDATGAAARQSTPQTEASQAEVRATPVPISGAQIEEDTSASKPEEIKISTPASASSSSSVICHKCGNQLMGEEQFCGTCGLPRSSDYEPPSMQSKVASLWHMQEEAERKKNLAEPESGEIEALTSNEALAKNLSGVVLEGKPQIAAQSAQQIEADDVTPVNQNAEETPADPKPASYWSSAASARDFLEQLATRPGALGRFWNARRGDIYLAIAVILVIGVIRWGIWSNHSVGASGSQPSAVAHTKPAAPAAPEANLSLFDRMLISLGLADAPQPPESRGNPETQVWVDLQTALYYCPGADLYGKTLKGKFASQRDAQLDQFESASRKACN